jgi:hypothetical protein
MKKRITFFSLLLLLCLGYLKLTLYSFQDKRDQTGLQHEVSVVLKLIQAFVTDKEGHPITDLKKSDFILYDNGKLMTITDFEKHFLSSFETEEAIDVTEPEPQREVPLLLNRIKMPMCY